MNEFLPSLQSWQLFFSTVAAASATFTRLLFVSLSLNRDRLKESRSHITLASARLTFSDFVDVLMIAIVSLVSHQIPFSLTVALLVLGIARAIGIVQESFLLRKRTRQKMDTKVLLREFGLPAVVSIGLIAVAIATYFGITDSIYGLVIVIAALLLTACWRAWLLLVEE